MSQSSITGPWVRLPAAPLDHASVAAAAMPPSTTWIWPIAVEAAGRRSPRAPHIDDVTPEAFQDAARRGIELIPLLDHAGPMAGLHLSERPRGPAALASDVHGRTPQPLDDRDWAELVGRYGRASARVRACGAQRVLLGADQDGLLAATLSPRTNPAARRAERVARILATLEAIRGTGLDVGMAICVEELCPGGLDASTGIEVARACETAGCDFFVASAGSASLPALRWRDGARGDDDIFLASAAWLVGRIAAPVWASGPCPEPMRALQRARALGLAGVACELPDADALNAR